jgi:hypothetical protein
MLKKKDDTIEEILIGAIVLTIAMLVAIALNW